MRPVTVAAPPANEYDEQVELNRQRYFNQEGVYWTRTVQQLIQQLQVLIDGWVARGYYWRSDADEEEYDTYLKRLGNGYGNARRWLISQIGQYCSYCDAPVYSHLHIEHTLPKSRFPGQAFSFTNFLLACPTCNSIKTNDPNQETLNTDTVTAQAAIPNPDNYAWPGSFYQGLPANSELPFRYDLVAFEWVFRRPVPGRLITPDEYPELLVRYRNGEIEVINGRVTVPSGNGRGSSTIGVWLEPTAIAPRTGAMGKMINLTEQNQMVLPRNAGTIDRRMELRTLAFFKALDLRDLLQQAHVTDAVNLAPLVSNRIKETMRATGFWGVWLWMFNDLPGIQPLLRSLFPGTAALDWTYP